jgi:hypothetical protein
VRDITTASNAPATIRRAINPVIRTLSLSPIRVLVGPEFVADAPNSCYSEAPDRLPGVTLVGYPAAAK